ncbi:ABC transporter ATP-binding protein [Nonomuraea sp. NPDC050663]|uniref:ABC transporter ATP-binding protein n=1 Tax=Nonomuraea sp. NPDC050663 TaxID=3364370 RepID=UPI0037A4632D
MTVPAGRTAGPVTDRDAAPSPQTAARLVAGLPPSPAVWCSGLRKRYGKRQAVAEVSLEVKRGEVVGLLGPNGAGKTTVIKMLLGLVRPDAGEVMLLGAPATDPAARAQVGYLPELFRYQPWLSAAEVLALHVRLSGIAVSAPEQHSCLDLVGLADRAGDRVGGFSKGMQQRLGLAVALVARPRFVILDEPTSALDPLGRVDVRDIVLGLRSRGVAVLLNSHLIGEVERVCDRVVILDKGRVAASGTLGELLGQREVRLRLTGLSPDARARLAEAGEVVEDDGWQTVALAGGDDEDVVPDLVRDLVRLGTRVHAVEPGRISLEERLLGILRAGSAETGTHETGTHGTGSYEAGGGRDGDEARADDGGAR